MTFFKSITQPEIWKQNFYTKQWQIYNKKRVCFPIIIIKLLRKKKQNKTIANLRQKNVQAFQLSFCNKICVNFKTENRLCTKVAYNLDNMCEFNQ